MTSDERYTQACSIYEDGLERVKKTKPPKGQKFPIGTRVRIFFGNDCNATVLYTYAHAYGGDDVKSYCLDVDGAGKISWFEEQQLTKI